MTSRLAVLRTLELGAPVAELDQRLFSYFVSTETLRQFIEGRTDIILGQKGSGKSAILRIVHDAKDKFPQLANVLVIEASNQEHLGNPVFKHVFEEFQTRKVDLSQYEPQLIDAWKVYFLSILWSQLGAAVSLQLERDDVRTWKSLSYVGGDLLSQMKFAFLRVLYFKSLEARISAAGTFEGKLEFPDQPPETQVYVPFAQLFSTINAAVASKGTSVWVLMDRLDEAFPGNEALETAGVKSILNAYKDLSSLSNLKVKISLREDLLEKATQGGFPALTHIRPRMSSAIRWDNADLMALIIRRFVQNESVAMYLSIHPPDIQTPAQYLDVFYKLCPMKVDAGAKKPDTFNWILARIRDGQGLQTPRDFVSFFNHLKGVQIRVWERDGEPPTNGMLFTPGVFKAAFAELSKEKLTDHLLAENPDLTKVVRLFRRQKAEHSEATLQKLLGAQWEQLTERLQKVGFLEPVGQSWKVPMVYRPALDIVQGAAKLAETEES